MAGGRYTWHLLLMPSVSTPAQSAAFTTYMQQDCCMQETFAIGTVAFLLQLTRANNREEKNLQSAGHHVRGLLPRSTKHRVQGCKHRMENPREDIKDVIRGLVCKPTLDQQEEVLRRYFTEDVKFFHFWVNDEGLDNLIATYQSAELVVNYQDVTFHNIAYDEGGHVLSVHMSVGVRSVTQFFFKDYLHFHSLLELEVRKDKLDGRNKHYIRVQRDYFIRDPLVQLQPVVGRIYNLDEIRLVLGRAAAVVFRLLQSIYSLALPTNLQKSLYHLWLEGPHGKPTNFKGSVRSAFT